MQIKLIAVGTRMPAWVNEGYQEYVRRMPHECNMTLTEVPLAQRSKSQAIDRAINEEGKRMLAETRAQHRVIALDVKGKQRSTPQLASELEQWLMSGDNYSLLIGGPDGIAPECLAKAERRWSLGDLTLPHPLVRIILAEQLYRAWTITVNHPYHRE